MVKNESTITARCPKRFKISKILCLPELAKVENKVKKLSRDLTGVRENDSDCLTQTSCDFSTDLDGEYVNVKTAD